MQRNAVEAQKPRERNLDWYEHVFFANFLLWCKFLLIENECVLPCEKGWTFSGETPERENVRSYIDMGTTYKCP